MWRILIVEDSPTNMMLTVEILKIAGYMPLQAITGNEGLRIAREQKPDIILLDMQLPDISGFEVARILKADPDTRGIVVIALTAFAMVGDKERTLEAGCDGYIEKPIRYKAFLEETERIMREHEESASRGKSD